MTGQLSFKSILLDAKWKISLTLALVVVESIIGIFFPLVIGLAINDLLEDSYVGITHLALLGVASLIIGSLRRFYDTRAYAGVYLKSVTQMVSHEQKQQREVSSISARANLMTEFVEFLENAMPDIVDSLIAVVGVLILIATLNVNVFWACIGLLTLMITMYLLTGKRNYALNKSFNDEFEKQVTVVTSKSKLTRQKHFRALMRWNIALSDLETFNYFVIWAGVIALFVYTPIQVIDDGVLNYGLVLSILMYVFDYIERLVVMPLHIQQTIRLHEISRRLST